MSDHSSDKMFIGVLVLWGGLVILGLVLAVIGLLGVLGKTSGNWVTLIVGVLIFARSVIKVIGLKKQIDNLKQYEDGND